MTTKFVKFDYENYKPAPPSEAQIKRDEEHSIYNNVNCLTRVGRAFGMQKTLEDDQAMYVHWRQWTGSGEQKHRYKIMFGLFGILSAGLMLISI